MATIVQPNKRRRTRAAALVGLIMIAVPAAPHAQPACPAATRQPSPADTWVAAAGHHPLVGSVLRGSEPLASAADACSPNPLQQLQRALTAHLADGGIGLLGEVHDNGAQHALRGHLIGAIAADLARQGRRPPALVLEHVRTDQAAVLDQPAPPTPEGAREKALSLLQRLDWDKSGWPAAELFLPIFEAAAAHGLPILTGNPTRAEVRNVARQGLPALPGDTVARLGMDVPLAAPLADALLDELEASHCGLMPRTAFTNMALAQRYRDAHMAGALIAAANEYGAAILLAGNGHVRADRGVPWDIARMAPGRKVMSVTLLEVEDGKTDAAAYVPRDPQGAPTADYVVLTPRVDRPDPCEAMRARFNKG